jgi:hypothetical protein
MTGFRRLVLELGHGADDPAAMRQAAGFAKMLDVELHALFVENEMLLHASALPFAREISSLSLSWRRLEPDRLQSELRFAADRARLHLIEAARATGVALKFEVHRGDPASTVTETCVAGDIVVVAPPHRATHGFERPNDPARRSIASVLFLAPHSRRTGGPIVAVATGPDDPSLAVARSIAGPGQENLVVVATLSGIAANTRARLIVMTRTASAAGSEVALAQETAVLMISP